MSIFFFTNYSVGKPFSRSWVIDDCVNSKRGFKVENFNQFLSSVFCRSKLINQSQSKCQKRAGGRDGGWLLKVLID